MPLKLGSTTIGSLYLGSTKIAAAYLGSTKIYEASAPTPLTFVQQNFPVQWPTGEYGIQFPTNLGGSDIERVQLCVLSVTDPSVTGYPQIELYVSQTNAMYLPYNYALVSNTPTIGPTTRDSTTGKYSTTYTFAVPSAIASDLSSGQLYAYMITNSYGSGTVDGYDDALCGYWSTSGGGGGGNITWNPSSATINHESPSQISFLQIASGTANTNTGIETITIDGSGLQNDTWGSKSIVVTLFNTIAGITVDLTLPVNGGTFGTVQYNLDLSTVGGTISVCLYGNRNSSWNSWETVTGNITVSSEPASNGGGGGGNEGGGDYDDEFE